MKKHYEAPEVEKVDFCAMQQLASLGLDPVGMSRGVGGDHLDNSEFLGGDNSGIVTP